jgi:hypothetical protein
VRELAAVASVLFGFSLWSLALPARRPKCWQSLRAPASGLRLAGAGAFALSVAVLWPDGASYAVLFTVTAGCAAATLVTLLSPVLLRAPGSSVAPEAPGRARVRSTFTFRPASLALALVTLVGTVPGALLLGLGLTLRLPFALETRLAIGFGSIFAFWLTAVCLIWLSRSGLRAVGWCLAFAALGALLVGSTP